MEQRECNHCNQIKDNTPQNFPPDRNMCRVCVSARMKRYREANKEKVAEQVKQYRQANIERITEQRKQYREANHDKIKEQQEAEKEKRK